MVYICGPERRLLSRPHRISPQKIPTFCLSRLQLAVQGPPFLTLPVLKGVHQVHGSGPGTPAVSRYKGSAVLGRLAALCSIQSSSGPRHRSASLSHYPTGLEGNHREELPTSLSVHSLHRSGLKHTDYRRLVRPLDTWTTSFTCSPSFAETNHSMEGRVLPVQGCPHVLYSLSAGSCCHGCLPLRMGCGVERQSNSRFSYRYRLTSLRALFLPGEQNQLADFLSHHKPPPGEWCPHPEVVQI